MPTTEAGKRLLDRYLTTQKGYSPFTKDIDAIEAEAVVAERARIRAGVEGLPTWDKRTVPGGFHVNRAAVLRIIDSDSLDNTVITK